MTSIYNYPKSSCECYDNTKLYTQPEGRPSNMSVRGCVEDEYLKCHSTQEPFKVGIEPKERKGYSYMNPESMNFADDFYAVKCGDDKKTFVSHDPRLYDVLRATVIHVDRPPYSSQRKLNTLVGDETLDHYGQRYKGYEDTKGQIQYYIDNTISDAYYEPVYSIPSKVTGFLFKDPMGNINPQYQRVSGITNENPITKTEPYFGCLSWINDSQEHREGIMATQSALYNKQRWMPRWTQND